MIITNKIPTTNEIYEVLEFMNSDLKDSEKRKRYFNESKANIKDVVIRIVNKISNLTIEQRIFCFKNIKESQKFFADLNKYIFGEMSTIFDYALAENSDELKRLVDDEIFHMSLLRTSNGELVRDGKIDAVNHITNVLWMHYNWIGNEYDPRNNGQIVYHKDILERGAPKYDPNQKMHAVIIGDDVVDLLNTLTKYNMIPLVHGFDDVPDCKDKHIIIINDTWLKIVCKELSAISASLYSYHPENKYIKVDKCDGSYYTTSINKLFSTELAAIMHI